MGRWRNRCSIHLSNGNEEQLIEVFKKISPTDWVFSTWRSHYRTLLHGIEPSKLKQKILDGKSITIVDKDSNFVYQAIVTGILPIGVGVVNQSSIMVVMIRFGATLLVIWHLKVVSSMKFVSTRNYELPLYFVVEDNGVSTNTPTLDTWNGVQRDLPEDVIYYQYKSKYPHYGTGKWVVF